MLRFSLLIASTFVLSHSALAISLPETGIGPRTMVHPESFRPNYNFEGIVGLSNCSGSLVRLENSRDTDPALVFTNGHCLESGFPAPATYVYHKPSSRRFNVKDPSGRTIGQVNAVEVLYSTMTRTDLTIYKLGTTYAQIKSQFNVRPLTLANARPTERMPIEVISGYWQKGYTCEVEQMIPHLKEDKWTWDDSIRYSRPGCEVIGGTSGSPVILAGSRTMVGVNNTGNESGERCTVNNPCEIDAIGNVSFTQGYSYGQQTYWVYTCLNATGELDVKVPGCMLLN